MAPRAQQRTDGHTVFEVRTAAGFNEEDPVAPSMELRPLLLGPSDQILAATYERNDDASVWLLPIDLLGGLDAWLVAAFREWHDLYPARFPAVPDWRAAPGWSTAAEDVLERERAAAIASFRAAEEQHRQTISGLDLQLAVTREAADAYERTLLSSNGDELAGAVLTALRDLGFLVEDMDLVWPEDAKREDYRITDPSAEGWVALGEAKGFSKGVSETGLVSLHRWTSFYVQDEGKLPDRQWYIANSFLGEDPSTRPIALQGRDDVVTTFAAGNGLIFDCRALFILLVAVQRSANLAQPIRSVLRERVGRFGPAEADEVLASLASTAEIDDGDGLTS
jgi:hypothetical protein